MAVKLKLLLFLALITPSVLLFGQSSKLQQARLSLKKWGVAYCISESYNKTNTQADSLARNAQSAYFQTGSYNGKAYEYLGAFIKEYIRSAQYNSEENKDLSLMKCLDLFTNKEFDKKVVDCDKWIQK